MIQKKRISDLSFEERMIVCNYVAANKKDINLINNLYFKFGLTYSPQSIRHVQRMAQYPEELKRLARDEAVMDKWRKSLETASELNYAEVLDQLFKRKLDPVMFKHIVEIEKLA